MYKTIIRRFLILIPQLIILTLGIFWLSQFMPGDVLAGFAEDPTISAEVLAEQRERLGLNDPWYVRYVRWVSGLLQGDLGRSWVHARLATDVIAERAANTFRLGVLSLLLTYLIAIPAGIFSGKYREQFADKAIILYTFFAIAMPIVVLGLINLFFFGVRLRWFPLANSVDPTITSGTFAYYMSQLRHVFLPALTIALLSTATIINLLRSEIIDNENSDFVLTARSKGLPSRVVYNKHIFKNASLPIVAGLGLALSGILGGSILIERLFSFPGMGQLFFQSILVRDWPIINALVLVYAVLVVFGTLLSDIFITILDPRVRIR